MRSSNGRLSASVHATNWGRRGAKSSGDERGCRTKDWTSQGGRRHPGRRFSKNTLTALLNNVLYMGSVRHKGVFYPGEQEAIVDRGLWERVTGQPEDFNDDVQSRAGKDPAQRCSFIVHPCTLESKAGIPGCPLRALRSSAPSSDTKLPIVKAHQVQLIQLFQLRAIEAMKSYRDARNRRV
jgi:hypothetical protein